MMPKSDNKPPVLKLNSGLEVKNQMFGKPKRKFCIHVYSKLGTPFFTENSWRLGRSGGVRLVRRFAAQKFSVKKLAVRKATLRYSSPPRNQKIRRSQKLVP